MKNLLLYYYERKWLLQSKKRDGRRTCIFLNILGLQIDNLCTFNNDEFENNYNDIYPDELALKKENEDPCITSFLDL